MRPKLRQPPTGQTAHQSPAQQHNRGPASPTPFAGDPESQDFFAKMELFQDRLSLWFNREDEEHEVVATFGDAYHKLRRLRSDVAGALSANSEAIALLQEAHAIQTLEEQSATIWDEAKADADQARARFNTVAHAYLAGDPE